MLLDFVLENQRHYEDKQINEWMVMQKHYKTCRINVAIVNIYTETQKHNPQRSTCIMKFCNFACIGGA